MELDDLKNIWQNSERFQPKHEEEIALMLKRRSKSVITKLKWSVWFELSFTILAGILLLYYSFTIPGGALRWSFISFLVLFLGYIIYYVKKIRILQRFEENSTNIKANLENLINDLNAYVKFYQMSYTIMYPLYMVLIILFVIIDHGFNEFLENLKNPKTILYLVLLDGVFFISSLWLTKWYVKKLYGNHIENLKKILFDFQEEKL
jgi:hypothetical protein